MTCSWTNDEWALERWVERSVECAGAHWINEPTWHVGPVDVLGLGETLAVMLKTNNVVEFWQDHATLKVEFVAYSSPAGWKYTEYSYRYATSDSTQVFRFDKHYEPDGADSHVHVGTDRNNGRYPTDDVDLGDVLAKIVAYQTTGTFSYG